MQKHSLKILAFLIFAMYLPAGLVFAADSETPEGHGGETVWTCPMHPQIQSSESGQCPICSMRLIEVKKTSAHMEQPVMNQQPSMNQMQGMNQMTGMGKNPEPVESTK